MWGRAECYRQSWGIVCTLRQVGSRWRGGKRRRAGVPSFSFHPAEQTRSLQPCAGCWEQSKRPHRKRGSLRGLGGSGGEPAGLGRPPEGALGPLCHFSSTVLIILIMREQSVEEVGGGSSGVKWLGFRGDSDARAEEQQRLRGARGDRSEPASRPARMGLGGAGQQTAGEVRSSRIPG